LPFAGKTLPEQYALGDFHIDGDLTESELHIFSSEHGFLGVFPLGNKHFARSPAIRSAYRQGHLAADRGAAEAV
jgi:hypothetical protein